MVIRLNLIFTGIIFDLPPLKEILMFYLPLIINKQEYFENIYIIYIYYKYNSVYFSLYCCFENQINHFY